METKICIECKEPKSLDEFSKTWRERTKVPSHWCWHNTCKPCSSKLSSAHQKANWDQIKIYRDTDEYRRSQKNGWLLKTYHRTIDWYDEQFAKQGGVCAICGKPETRLGTGGRPKSLAVDHDHACCSGKKSCGDCIRGLLCEGCNHTLGFVRDDVDSLQQAILYLKSFKKENENAERIDHP